MNYLQDSDGSWFTSVTRFTFSFCLFYFSLFYIFDYMTSYNCKFLIFVSFCFFLMPQMDCCEIFLANPDLIEEHSHIFFNFTHHWQFPIVRYSTRNPIFITFFSKQAFSMIAAYLTCLVFQDVLFVSSFHEFLLQCCTDFLCLVNSELIVLVHNAWLYRSIF